MAIYSSNVAQKSGYSKKVYKRTVVRKTLTSPLLLSDTTGRLSKIFYGHKSPLGRAIVKEKKIINEETGEFIYVDKAVEDTFPGVRIIQKALYLYFTEYTRQKNKAGDSTFTVDEPLKFYKYTSTNNISKAIFTGKYDAETERYVAYFQLIHDLPTDSPNISGVDREFLGKTDCNVIAQLDIELAKIHCYKFAGNGDDKTYVSHNYSRFKEKPFRTVGYQSIAENSADPSPGPKNGHIYLYSRPEKFKKNRLSPSITPFITRVNVLQDLDLCKNGIDNQPLNEQYDGWYYVSAIIDGQTIFGYCDKLEIWKTPMPESGAVLHKVLSGETVVSTIRHNYYNYNCTEDSWKNDHDLVLHMSPGAFGFYNEQYYQFKFYVNMLLYANNETGIMPQNPGPGEEETIGLVFENAPPMNNDFKNKIAGTNAFENTASDKSNYQYFLEKLTEGPGGNPYYNWDWNGEGSSSTNTIQLNEGYYLWIPSRQFADTLYAYVNRKSSYLHNLAINIRNVINDKWDPGYGVSLEGSLGITFGFPVHVEGGGSIYIYRKNLDETSSTTSTLKKPDIVIGIRKSGYLKVGAELSPGLGVILGNVKSRNNFEGSKLGAQIYASIGAGVRVHIETEYEFPLFVAENEVDMGDNYDHATIALMVKLLALVDPVGIIEDTALSFIEFFGDLNIDPGNYLTHMDVRVVGYGEASAGAFGGLKLIDGDDTSDPTAGNTQSSPYLVSQILRRAYAQIGITAGFEGAFGFEYNAAYEDVCFDNGSISRVPKKYEISLYTTAQYIINASIDLGPINLVNFNPEPYLGAKLTLDYTTVLASNPSDPDYLDFITTVGSATPTFQIMIGDGNWEAYGKTAFELGIALKANPPLTWDQTNIIDGIDYIYIKKRVALLDFENGGAQNQSNTHLQIKNFFRGNTYRKFGFKCDAFVDFEVRIDYDSLMESDLFTRLMTVINEIILHYQEDFPEITTINPLTIIHQFVTYINPFSSKKVSTAVNNFFQELTNIATVENLAFHTEIGGGFAAGVKVTNITVSFNILGLVVYHFVFREDDQWLINNPTQADIVAFFNDPLVKQALIFFVI